MKTKPSVVLTFAIAMIGVLLLGYGVYKNSRYTTLVEDVNNSCHDGISTRAAGKSFTIRVPSDQVEEYLEAARRQGRCIDRASENIVPSQK